MTGFYDKEKKDARKKKLIAGFKSYRSATASSSIKDALSEIERRVKRLE